MIECGYCGDVCDNATRACMAGCAPGYEFAVDPFCETREFCIITFVCIEQFKIATGLRDNYRQGLIFIFLWDIEVLT